MTLILVTFLQIDLRMSPALGNKTLGDANDLVEVARLCGCEPQTLQRVAIFWVIAKIGSAYHLGLILFLIQPRKLCVRVYVKRRAEIIGRVQTACRNIDNAWILGTFTGHVRSAFVAKLTVGAR